MLCDDEYLYSQFCYKEVNQTTISAYRNIIGSQKRDGSIIYAVLKLLLVYSRTDFNLLWNGIDLQLYFKSNYSNDCGVSLNDHTM